ncbi:hypothetical protein Aph02nite_24980 [Actinoplanes philippinensis]|uniref:Uncharacterized protein n=1 Tax=Actinoplanes philippinensis TaxID=35752 RepID=A0A1I2G4W7_9ACTN|nr:hypothetical protein [Actinoplanes philippinensis]GIE76548.1 hypothetical protein Aph02nite_24980 [Actinoplanes philippinensis]SFF11671.1 hypothetical protein SAMN05421541_106157 [Actinoplanes philippinensis]
MTEWDRAFHAYGPARDGKDLLDALRTGDEVRYIEEHPDANWQPYTFLWSALYCGGWITPATVLGLRYLVDTVTADDFGGADPTLRWSAVSWIRDVARAALARPARAGSVLAPAALVQDTFAPASFAQDAFAQDTLASAFPAQDTFARAALGGADLDDMRLAAARRDEPIVAAWLDDHLSRERSIFAWGDRDEPGRVLLAAAQVDCFDLLTDCCDPLFSLLAPDSPEELRSAAAGAVTALTGHPELSRHREEMITYQAAEARRGSPRYRAAMVLGLGELGAPTAEWLTDPAFAVRVCAALAPDCAGSAAAAAVLRQASLDPDAFTESLEGFHLHALPSPQAAVAAALSRH